MSRFEHDIRLDGTPINEIKVSVQSRDDIPALLRELNALLVLLTEVFTCCASHGVSGWRQGHDWQSPAISSEQMSGYWRCVQKMGEHFFD